MCRVNSLACKMVKFALVEGQNGMLLVTFHTLNGFSFLFQSGMSPLHLAAKGGHLEVVRCLLLSGADPDLPNKVQRLPCVNEEFLLDWAGVCVFSHSCSFLLLGWYCSRNNGVGSGAQRHRRTPHQTQTCKSLKTKGETSFTQVRT